MAGEENDRHVNFDLRQLLLKSEAVHSRQSHVEHEAAVRRFWRAIFEKRASGCEKLNVQSDGLEKLLEGRPQRRIIINYEDA